MIEFKDLPVEIQERMLDEQVRQGNPRNAEVFEKDITTGSSTGGGFTWDYSVEGHAFWANIVNGNFAIFYERYPKSPTKSPTKLYSEEEVRNLFIKHSRDLYTTNEKFYEFLLEQDLKWFEENKK